MEGQELPTTLWKDKRKSCHSSSKFTYVNRMQFKFHIVVMMRAREGGGGVVYVEGGDSVISVHCTVIRTTPKNARFKPDNCDINMITDIHMDPGRS